MKRAWKIFQKRNGAKVAVFITNRMEAVASWPMLPLRILLRILLMWSAPVPSFEKHRDVIMERNVTWSSFTIRYIDLARELLSLSCSFLCSTTYFFKYIYIYIHRIYTYILQVRISLITCMSLASWYIYIYLFMYFIISIYKGNPTRQTHRRL